MRFVMLLSWLVTLIVCANAQAQSEDPRNAAYWYQRAIEKLNAIPQDQREQVLNYMYDEPTPELRNALRTMEPVLSLIQRGAAQQYSDFGLDLSKGFELTLPHLAELRQCTKLMQIQAHVKMHDGDGMGAARDLGALYNLGEHMVDDRIVISSLVGQAIFRHSDSAVQDGVDRGVFDAAASAELYKAIERFDQQDPFGYVETLFGEQELMVSTLENHFGDPTQTDEMLQMLVGESPHADAFLNDLKTEGLDAQINKVDATMNEVIGIFMIEDEEVAKQKMQEFEAKIEAGEFGSLAMLLMPAYGRIHDMMLLSRKEIADRRAMLEQLAKGEIDPSQAVNAALIYKQAIDAWYEMDPAKRAAVLETAERATQAIEEGVIGILVEATPVIDLTRRASQLKRCDFEILRRHQDLSLAPDSVIGMNELLTIIRLDALRLAREKNGADAADRLAIGFRAIGHMSGDSVPTGSLVAHCAFNDLAAQLKACLNAGLYEDKRDELREAVERIPQRDPFGYVNAVMGTRKTVENQLRWLIRESGATETKPVNDWVRDWQGDALMYVVTILETNRENNRKEAPANGGDEVAPNSGQEIYIPLLIDRIGTLENVISLDAVKSVQAKADELGAQLAGGKLDVVSQQEIASIGDWNERMNRARNDLREARKLVTAEEGESNDVNRSPPSE